MPDKFDSAAVISRITEEYHVFKDLANTER